MKFHTPRHCARTTRRSYIEWLCDNIETYPQARQLVSFRWYTADPDSFDRKSQPQLCLRLACFGGSFPTVGNFQPSSPEVCYYSVASWCFFLSSRCAFCGAFQTTAILAFRIPSRLHPRAGSSRRCCHWTNVAAVSWKQW